MTPHRGRPVPPIERAFAAMPEMRLWFCGSCGCYDRSQDHAPDCDEDQRTPRFSVAYVPVMPQRLAQCEDCGSLTGGSTRETPDACGGCDSKRLVEVFLDA